MKILRFSIPLTFSLLLGGILISTQLANAQQINNASDDGGNTTNSDGALSPSSSRRIRSAIPSNTNEQFRATIDAIPESLQQEQSQTPETEVPETEVTQPQPPEEEPDVPEEEGETEATQPEAPEEEEQEEERQMQEQQQQEPVRGLW